MSAENYNFDDRSGRIFELTSTIVRSAGSIVVAAAGGVVTTVQEISRGELYAFHSSELVE